MVLRSLFVSLCIFGLGCDASIGEPGFRDITAPPDTLSTATVRPGAITAFGRGVVLPGLADPDAYVSESGNAYITGTFDGKVLPIWRLQEGVFAEYSRYNPSADPSADYCNVWAPDLAKVGDSWILSFAAAKVSEGAGCSQVGEQQIFYATAADESLQFGSPIVPDFGVNGPQSISSHGCPANGCNHALRIDPSLFTDRNGRVFLSYTWFENGNHNATIALDNPGVVITNTSPEEGEENVNEAPEIFERNGKYYFLYSVGDFRGDYRLRYIIADSVEELTKARGSHELTVPVHFQDGRKYETAGHGSVVEFGGEYFAIYHVGEMNAAGRLISRSTVVSPLQFLPDNTMRLLNAVDVQWTIQPGHSYSVDVRSNGEWIGPCADAGVIGQGNHVRLTDLCPFNDTPAPLETVDRIRLCHTANGDWSRAQCVERAFTHESDELFMPL